MLPDSASPDYLAHAGALRQPPDIAHHACLRYTGKVNPTVWQFFDSAGGLITIPIDAALASDDAEVLVDTAVAGLGLLYATDWLVGRQLASGALIRVLPDWRIPDEGAIHIVTASLAGMPNKTGPFPTGWPRGFSPTRPGFSRPRHEAREAAPTIA
ncbi:LysR substrate-binding domain-containing protein [Corticibacterium sp. UT-5YL-CI-8]|nr:LysR substrate-binding domain-containing protein [Tianweitania sp. UT-5YL-CI-8]